MSKHFAPQLLSLVVPATSLLLLLFAPSPPLLAPHRASLHLRAPHSAAPPAVLAPHWAAAGAAFGVVAAAVALILTSATASVSAAHRSAFGPLAPLVSVGFSREATSPVAAICAFKAAPASHGHLSAASSSASHARANHARAAAASTGLHVALTSAVVHAATLDVRGHDGLVGHGAGSTAHFSSPSHPVLPLGLLVVLLRVVGTRRVALQLAAPRVASLCVAGGTLRVLVAHGHVSPPHFVVAPTATSDGGASASPLVETLLLVVHVAAAGPAGVHPSAALVATPARLGRWPVVVSLLGQRVVRSAVEVGGQVVSLLLGWAPEVVSAGPAPHFSAAAAHGRR